MGHAHEQENSKDKEATLGIYVILDKGREGGDEISKEMGILQVVGGKQNIYGRQMLASWVIQPPGCCLAPSCLPS